MASLWLRGIGIVIAAAVLCAATTGCASTSQKVAPKKNLPQMRYYGGPKAPMWRG